MLFHVCKTPSVLRGHGLLVKTISMILQNEEKQFSLQLNIHM